MYGQFNDFGLIIPAFILLALVWALAIIYIWFDADEVYGTGWFWLVAVLVVPLVAIPVYGLMKLGTHRSWKEEMAAQDLKDRKRNQGQRFCGQVWDIQKRLSGGTGMSEDHGCVEIERRVKFRPFRHTFAASAERLRRKVESIAMGDSGNGTVAEGRDDNRAGTESRPIEEVSSQGCGDRLRDHRLNERMSWRARQDEVQSRWTTARDGGGYSVATRDEMPF